MPRPNLTAPYQRLRYAPWLLAAYGVVFWVLLALPLSPMLQGLLVQPLVASAALYGGLKGGLWVTGMFSLLAVGYGRFFPVDPMALGTGVAVSVIIVCFTGIPVDIARRKQDALQQLDQTHRTLFDHALNGFALHRIVLDEQKKPIDYVFLDANKAFEEQTGLIRHNILGQRVTEVLPGIQETDFIPIYGQVALSGESQRIERYSPNLDRWYDISVFSPEPNIFATVFSDITERKAIEEALRHNEARLRAIIEDQTELICRFTPEGILTFVNQAYCTYFNRTREQLIGQSFMPLIPEEDQEISASHFASLSQDHPVTTYEHRVILDDGQIRWQQWTDRVICDQHGQIVEYQAVGQDITDRKDAECKLQHAHDTLERKVEQRTAELQMLNEELRMEVEERSRAEERLYAETERLSITLASIGDGVISINPEGQIELLNQAATAITRWEEQAAKGRLWQTVICLQDGPAKASHVDQILHTRFGEQRIVNVTCSPMHTESGIVLGQVMIIKDVTERRKVDQQLALTQKLESIGQLAAGIAHEINTPMQFIGDNTTFVAESFAEITKLIEKSSALSSKEWSESQVANRWTHLQAEVPQALVETQQGIEQVNSIVSAMKDFAHPGGPGDTLANINQIVTSTVAICRNEWKYAVDLKLQLADGLPLVRCIPGKVSQALLAILMNAIQAIDDARRHHHIDQGRLVVTTSLSDDHVVITVEDNGMGIPASAQDKVFDLFFTTKPVGSGTGQGLPIAHNIVVDKHKGTLDFRSQPGHGTVFVISLPVNGE